MTMNEKIAVFDLHCDTVWACLKQGAELKRNHLQLDLERGTRDGERWIQTLAFLSTIVIGAKMHGTILGINIG